MGGVACDEQPAAPPPVGQRGARLPGVGRQDLRVDAKLSQHGVAEIREQPLVVGIGGLLK